MIISWLFALQLAAQQEFIESPAVPKDRPICSGVFLQLAQACERNDLGTFQGELESAVRQHDVAGDGLDANDVELVRDRQRARERAEALGRILKYDLDGNLQIDRSEMERAVPSDFFDGDGARSAGGKERQRALFFAHDADRNERIDRSEIFDGPLPQGNAETLEGLRAVMAADADNNHRIDAAELSALAARLFREVDTDGDGRISAEEIEAQRKRSGNARHTITNGYWKGMCALPKPHANAGIMLFSSHSGLPIDSGQEATSVRIEPGSSKLYLVLTSKLPVVWHLSGAVQRVDRVILNSGGNERLSEATGVPADRVVASGGDCFRTGTDKWAMDRIAGHIWRSAGRLPDVAIVSHAADMVSFPSGEIKSPFIAATPWTPSNICADGAKLAMPATFGSEGVQAMYSFVTQGADDKDMSMFLKAIDEAGFSIVPIIISLGGRDTLAMYGRSPLQNADEARRELRAACALRTGKNIYLVHARHNLGGEKDGWVRVR